jgi:hypothetical protein
VRVSDAQMREHLSQLAWDEYTRWRREVERLRSELKEAHNWLLAAEMCDCEYFEGAGTYLCRFAEALRDPSPTPAEETREQQ